jgi:hypothetical protein
MRDLHVFTLRKARTYRWSGGAVFGTGFLVSLGFSDVAAVAVCLLTVLALAWLRLPGIRQAYVEIMDILKTRIDEAVSAG